MKKTFGYLHGSFNVAKKQAVEVYFSVSTALTEM